MAKSTRSKTKRAYRKVKREDSVYAVAHAARLDRLSKKLADIANVTEPSTHPEKDDDSSEERLDMDEQGWPIFALFGLIDPDDISIFTIGHDDERQPCSKEET
ncbi:5221_t:CDS:1, partial [Acaulospora colombiana]